MNSVVHFEIPVNEAASAKQFYGDVFGWNITQWEDQQYWMAETTEMDATTRRPKEVGSINGGMMPRGEFKSPILTISVDDIDAALQKIEAAGGKKLKGKESIGEMGWTGYFEDNQGNVMGLWQTNMANMQKSE